MLNLNIDVNINWLKYFKKKLNKQTKINIILSDSNSFKNYFSKIYESKKKFLYKILSDTFWDFDIKIKLEVYPEYFYLWAINTELGIMVLWQPRFCKHYYLWLLSHEISHFLLKKFNLNRFIEEIVCFSIEKKIIEIFDDVDTIDFLYYKDIDFFHTKAFFYTHEFYDEFNNNDLIWFIKFLERKIPTEFKILEISTNLTNYLKENE
jgi:hypothetical protein